MGQPTYSIIIPAYNESLRLGATLDAILAYAEQKLAPMAAVDKDLAPVSYTHLTLPTNREV